MLPMQLRCVYTADDLGEASKRVFGAQIRRYLSFIIVSAIFIVAGFSCRPLENVLWPMPEIPQQPIQQIMSYGEFAWEFLPWALIVAYVTYAVRFLIKRHRDQPLVGESHTILVEDAGITWIDAVSRFEFRWAAFYGFHETRNLFAIIVSNPKRGPVIRFHIIPKRSLMPEQVGGLRELLDARTRSHETSPPLHSPPRAE